LSQLDTNALADLKLEMEKSLIGHTASIMSAVNDGTYVRALRCSAELTASLASLWNYEMGLKLASKDVTISSLEDEILSHMAPQGKGKRRRKPRGKGKTAAESTDVQA
jgi:hypothetical protein